MDKNITNLSYSYHIEIDEYWDGQKHTTRFETVIYTFLNLLLIVSFIIFSSNPNVYDVFSTATILFIGQFLFYLFSKYKMRKIIKNNPCYTSQINLQITENRIELSQNNIKRSIPKEYIVKLKELKKTILIYYSPYKSIIIPKKIMSEDELHLIRDIFNIS